MARRIVVDYPLLVIAVVLSLFGVSVVYSAGQTDVPTFVSAVYRTQAMWLFIGMAAAYGLAHSSVRLIEWAAWPAYLFTLALLALLLVFGAGTGAGSHIK